MPTVKVKRKTIKVRPNPDARLSIQERAERTIRRIEAKIAEDRAKREKFRAPRKEPEYLDLKKPEHIHVVTDQACWRPDLYFAGDKYCDFCPLYQHCQARCSRLKNAGSQPPKVIVRKLEDDIAAFSGTRCTVRVPKKNRNNKKTVKIKLTKRK